MDSTREQELESALKVCERTEHPCVMIPTAMLKMLKAERDVMLEFLNVTRRIGIAPHDLSCPAFALEGDFEEDECTCGTIELKDMLKECNEKIPPTEEYS